MAAAEKGENMILHILQYNECANCHGRIRVEGGHWCRECYAAAREAIALVSQVGFALSRGAVMTVMGGSVVVTERGRTFHVEHGNGDWLRAAREAVCVAGMPHLDEAEVSP